MYFALDSCRLRSFQQRIESETQFNAMKHVGFRQDMIELACEEVDDELKSLRKTC